MSGPPTTVHCMHCGQRVSPSAAICPKCGKGQQVDRLSRPCRVCNAPLSKYEHRYFVPHGLVFSEVHRACPMCGDPQPLWTPFDTLLQTVRMVFSVVVVVLAIGVGLILVRNYQDYRYEFSPIDGSRPLDADYYDRWWDPEHAGRGRGCTHP